MANTGNHPLSYYTSRKIDFSVRLNAILESSSKIVVEKRCSDEAKSSISSESLGKYNKSL